MAVYANLKDYFQGEHLDLIKASISEYCSEHQYTGEAEDVQVQKLRCLYKKKIPDISSDIEIEAGVSVQFVDREDNSDSAERFFLIHISGDLRLKLRDIEVSVIKEICESEMPEETIENKFLLPNIKADNIENTGKIIYYGYLLDTDSKSVATTCKTLIEKMKVPIYYADFDDTCLGRINLSESDLDIYRLDETTNELVLHSKKAIYGTIILNKRKYFEEKDGEYLITVCHELVHWQFHQKFFKILMLLGNTEDALNYKAQLPIYNESMNDSQKALCIAEWQANELSWSIVMPKIGIDQMIELNDKILADNKYPSSVIPDLKVAGIAYHFHVSPYVAKIRLRQLGYDFADGTCLEFDGKRYLPFAFAPGSLKQNETFVINRTNFEKLLREDKELADLIESHYFIYTGCVVCMNDIKFIKVTYSDVKLLFNLTDYAREHADECCMKFTYHSHISEFHNINYPISNFLFRLYTTEEYGTEDNDGHYTLSDAAMKDRKAYELKKQQILNIQKVLAEMAFNGIKTFQETLKYHLKKRNLKPSDICDEDRLKKDTLDSYLADEGDKGHRNPPLEKIMVICNFLQLEYELSIDLLSKAGVKLVEGKKKDDIYDYLLTITNAPISAWDTILTEEGLKPIGKNKK